MDKTSHSVKGNPSVEGVTRLLSLDLNQPPDEVEIVDLREKPKDDVPPLPHFYVDPRFCKEDMELLKQKPKVLGSSPVACSDYFENLGFCNGNTTLICTRNKRVHFSSKSLYNLGRSWFNGGFIENDKQQADVDCMKSLPEPMQDDEEEEPAGDIVGDGFEEVLEEIPVEQQDVDCVKSLAEPMCEEVSNDGDKEKEKQQDVDCMKTLPEPMCEVSKEGDMEKEKRDDDDANRLAFKEILRDSGKEAKVQARNARKKGKMVQKQVRATSAPPRRKRKVPKMRSLKDIYNDNKSQILEQLV